VKTTIVPAQITTIEDRIAGNLGLSQLLLLSMPVFMGGAIYICLPPTMHNAAYKLSVISILSIACCILSIRIKGKILLIWLIVILRYNFRPRHYVFNKNTLTGRDAFDNRNAPAKKNEKVPKVVKHKRQTLLNTQEIVNLHNILENPAANLTFKNTKGDLHVLITEIEK
jgi:hypothetical protein